MRTTSTPKRRLVTQVVDAFRSTCAFDPTLFVIAMTLLGATTWQWCRFPRSSPRRMHAALSRGGLRDAFRLRHDFGAPYRERFSVTRVADSECTGESAAKRHDAWNQRLDLELACAARAAWRFRYRSALPALHKLSWSYPRDGLRDST